jgi:hypothetical protein
MPLLSKKLTVTHFDFATLLSPSSRTPMESIIFESNEKKSAEGVPGATSSLN